jgi:hypothetical protein
MPGGTARVLDPYQKPVLYMGDYDVCLRDVHGGWVCLFRETPGAKPYEVRHFDSLVDAFRYKYGAEVVEVSAVDSMVCVTLNSGEKYCHSDEL